MYPRQEQRLDLFTIVQDWARDLPQHPDKAEIWRLLLKAFWRGKLKATWSDNEDDPRRVLLEWLGRHPDHPVLCVVDTMAAADFIIFHEDGGVSIPYATIFWPEDSAARTPEIFAKAYATLADLDLQVYSETTQTMLRLLKVDREDFAAFCDENGYDQPKFWFRRKLVLRDHAKARECREWLKAEVKQHGETRPWSKKSFLSMTRKKFGLPESRAERIWDQTVPTGWKKVGRPRRPQTSG